MSQPFLVLVWATGDEGRPYECVVFDRYVDTPLREGGEADDIAASLGEVISLYGADLPTKLTSASGSRFLVITLDATRVRGQEEVLYADDLRQIVEGVQTYAGGQSAELVPEFESRANWVARGFWVPSTRLPSSTIQFAKDFKNCINVDMKIEVEKDLRAAVVERFSLPNVERAALFERLFADLPADFEGRAAALAEINDAFRQELAARLTPALNAHLEEATPEDAEAKKQLASDVMEKLTNLGLAVRCPDTDQPSRLVGQQDSKNPRGRISITPKGVSRPSRSRTDMSELLPIELVANRPRREALDEWREQANRQGSPQRGGK